jgi:hypothetical protein
MGCGYPYIEHTLNAPIQIISPIKRAMNFIALFIINMKNL